jgi:hypothetical protein
LKLVAIAAAVLSVTLVCNWPVLARDRNETIDAQAFGTGRSWHGAFLPVAVSGLTRIEPIAESISTHAFGTPITPNSKMSE